MELERAAARRGENGDPAHPKARLLAQGDGWIVQDYICTSGARDRPFEERHSQVSIAIVAAGSFQYRSASGRDLMTPGSLMLGNPGQYFECGHEHAEGDRCISFRYAPDYFESLAADAGLRGSRLAFRALRLPPLRELAPLVARACAGLAGSSSVSWEELSIELATRTAQLEGGFTPEPSEPLPSAVARVTRAVRKIERNPEAGLAIGSLAREAGLTPYHFLRTFARLTSVTPHQYVLRTRLREAALRLTLEPAKVLDIALDCGFGDVSNFNRAFRGEFGMSPRQYRQSVIGGELNKKAKHTEDRQLFRLHWI
jgi:AraC family transcriptional regulator